MTSTRQGELFGNNVAVAFRDNNTFRHRWFDFAAFGLRLRQLLRHSGLILLVAVAIVGSWGLVAALVLWLIPGIVRAAI